MTTVVKKATLVMAMLAAMAVASTVSAEPLRARGIIVPRARIYSPYFYDRFWGPFYPYGVYGYGAYPYAAAPTADVRVQVAPKQTEVYVDGYYAGTADEFDGVFKRLHTTPGGHAITLHLDGYRTVTQSIYVAPDSTVKMQDTMDKLGPGEVSAAPPVPARPLRLANQSRQG